MRCYYADNHHHQLGAVVLLLLGEEGELLRSEVEGRAVVRRGPAKQEESLTHHHQGLSPPGVGSRSSWPELGPGPGVGIQQPEIILVLFGPAGNEKVST